MKFSAVWLLPAILLIPQLDAEAQENLVAKLDDPSPNSPSTGQIPSNPAHPTDPSAPEGAEAIREGLAFSGYFDFYYSANLNKPASRNNLGSSGVSRGFDRNAGQFQLGMLLTRLDYKASFADLVAEVGFGPNVEYGSYGSDVRYQWGTVVANTTYTSIMIKQAYVDVETGDRLVLTAGQFGTHIGYEYIDSPLNFHYSISNTFNSGIPFYHVGIKATYSLLEKVKVMAGVVNGTDNINDNNRGKSLIAQVAWQPSEKVAIYANTIQGNEANARPGGTDTTSYFGILDLVATFQISERLSAALWAMYGTQSGEFQGSSYLTSKQHWGGATLYVAYKFAEAFYLGTRLEWFDNADGVRALRTQGQGTRAATATLTGIFNFADGRLLVKPEYRLDDFQKMYSLPAELNAQQFMDRSGNYSLNTQSTLSLAAIYKF